MDEFLTQREVCKRLRVCPETLRSLNLPSVMIGKKHRRFYWPDVVATMKGRHA